MNHHLIRNANSCALAYMQVPLVFKTFNKNVILMYLVFFSVAGKSFENVSIHGLDTRRDLGV